MLLDIVEVDEVSKSSNTKYQRDLPLIQSHSGVNLAEAFEKILCDFGISDKVSVKCIHANEDSQVASAGRF
jgi:hypothetical protein